MNSMASLVLQVNATSVNAATISLNQLANAGAQAQSATTNLTSATNSANSSILANQQAWFSNTAAINSSTQAMSHLANGFKSAFFGASIAVGLIELKNHFINLTESLIQTQVQVDKLRNSLNFAVGKSAAVGDLAFIKQSAQDMGLSFVTVTEQYVRLAAASRQTSLEGQKTKDIFTAVSQASTVLGLSADETTGALRAITQMISKNTVMSEELKGQLGERLPGAFQIAARAMGVTTQELNKMLETGKVLAEDFLPKFAAQLLKETAPDIEAASQSMQASLNRLETAWTLFKQAVVKSGLGQSVSNEISGLGNYLSTLSESMDRARASGSGLSGQLMTGLGTALARMPFDAVNTSANLLNGTLNLLSAGTLNLSTNVNILPQMFETSAYASSQLASRLKDAEKDLAQLQAKLAVTPDNIYLKSEAYQAYLLVMQLRDAKKAKDDLTGNAGRGSVNPLTIGQMEEAAAKAQQKIDALMAKSSSVPDAYIKRAKEIAEANKDGAMTAQQLAVALGDLHSLLPKVSSAHTKLSEAQKLVNAGEKAYGDIMAKDTGYDANFTETILAMAAARDKNNWSAEKYNEVVNAYIAMQPGIKALADAEQKEAQAAAKLNTEAVDDLFDAQEKLRLQNEDQIKTGRTMLEQIEFETRLLDMNTEQRAIATLERELERQGIVKGTQAYDTYIAKLREAVAIKNAKEAGIESTKALADANRKAAEESSKYWEDALMRAFESGKGFFDSLWSTIKNTLKTQILKVSVQAVMGTLGLGAAGAAGAADGAMGLASTANALINLPATLSTLSASASALWAGLTATGSTAAGAASAGIAYSSAVAAGSGTAFTTGASLSSVFSAIPVWGWAALGAAALLGMNKKTPSAGTGEGNVTFDASGAPISATSRYTGSWGLTDTVQATLSSLYEDYAKAARSLGIATVQAEFGFGGNTGKEGKDPQFALGVNAGGVSYSSGEIKLTDANVQLAASRAVFAALQGSDLPEYLKGAFDDLMPANATQEQIEATLSQAAPVKTFHEAVQKLPFDSLKNLGFEATMALGDASGGLDVLVNTLTDVTNASATARAGIQALIDGIDTKVSGSIFDMQYGMEDNAGKYSMLDVRAARLNDQMLASTDISAIAAMAEDQIALINQAWSLLGDEQQKAKYLEFEDRLQKIDDYVTTRGADAISLQQAADDKTAATIAAAVEAAVEKAMATSAAAMQAVADKTEKPIEVTSNVNLTVTAPVGSEVAINA